MNVRSDLALAYHIGYEDALAKRMPDSSRAGVLNSYNCTNDCTNDERTETCHPVISDNLTESEGTGDAWADCSECGHLLFVLTDPNSQVPNFCPNCGAKVVEPTTNDVDVEVDA